jgi:hypothetical protein
VSGARSRSVSQLEKISSALFASTLPTISAVVRFPSSSKVIVSPTW